MEVLDLANTLMESKGKPIENKEDVLKKIVENHSEKGKKGALRESCLGFFPGY